MRTDYIHSSMFYDFFLQLGSPGGGRIPHWMFFIEFEDGRKIGFNRRAAGSYTLPNKYFAKQFAKKISDFCGVPLIVLESLSWDPVIRKVKATEYVGERKVVNYIKRSEIPTYKYPETDEANKKWVNIVSIIVVILSFLLLFFALFGFEHDQSYS